MVDDLKAAVWGHQIDPETTDGDDLGAVPPRGAGGTAYDLKAAVRGDYSSSLIVTTPTVRIASGQR